MQKIYKIFARIVPFFFLVDVHADLIDKNLELHSFIDKPLILSSRNEDKVTIKGDKSSVSKEFEFLIKNPEVTIKLDNSFININSKTAIYKSDVNIIEFYEGANLSGNTKDNNININSDEIIMNLSTKNMTSKKRVLGDLNQIKINSEGMNISNVKDGIYGEFNNANFIIRNGSSKDFGTSERLIISSKDSSMSLEGKASLNLGDFRIKSDSIMYDYRQNKILKSVNSKIESVQ